MNILPLPNELCDSLRGLSVKKRQGVLEIVAPEREYELTFLEGRIIHADRLDISLCEYLLQMLPEEDRSQLDQSRLKEAGKGDLITRIIESTRLTIRDLITLKHEYDRSTLQLLAGERSISFDFRTKIIRCPEGLSLDLSPGHFLLDLIEQNELNGATTPTSPANAPTAPAPAAKTVCASPGPIEPTPSPSILPTEKARRHPRRRKFKRPPRVGRWSKRSRKAVSLRRRAALSVSGNQVFLSVKLLLFLSLVLLAPGFLNDWVSTLISFSFP